MDPIKPNTQAGGVAGAGSTAAGSAQKALPPGQGGGKGWWWVLGVAVLVGLIVAGMQFSNKDKAADENTLPEDAAAEEADTVAKPGLLWEFAVAGTDAATAAPKTKVTLTADGEAHNLGTFTGPCTILDANSAWKLADGEVTAVICYFAGAGEEVGVFYDDGVYVVKKGVVEEGTAEVAGTRGNYEVLFTL